MLRSTRLLPHRVLFASALAFAALLCGPAAPAAMAAPASAPTTLQPGDDAVLQAREALRKKDRAALAAARNALVAAGHPLALWVDYWELLNRLDEAQQPELDAFYARWPGSYVEDRLRNDWLLVLGKRRDWANFRVEFPRFRMNDDREVTCYALLTQHLDGKPVHDAAFEAWTAQRDVDDGCLLLATTLQQDKVFRPDDLWRAVSLAVEMNRPRVARAAAGLIDDATGRAVGDLLADPIKFLKQRPAIDGAAGRELALLALMRAAGSDPDAAAAQLQSIGAERLSLMGAATAWAQIAKQSALKLQPQAADQARRAWQMWQAAARPDTRPPWSDDLLAWHVRAALRESPSTDADRRARWSLALQAIDAMSPGEQQDGAWVYWRARAATALAEPGPAGDPDRALASLSMASITSQLGFYGVLASEDLGRPFKLPPPPPPPSAEETALTRLHPGLARGLRLIGMGLRSEGVREWNFSLRGMNERQLLAASQWACEREVWDRCINTSDRTREEIDIAQRYPTPFRQQMLAKAGEIGIEPALMYGLIRQESRFIPDARSGVGASGLMQLMPATARWMARKIGMPFRNDMIHDRDVNLHLGAAYFKRVLDDFDGSLALAAAAYNAGPNRPRRWREGSGLMEPAAWAESIPFNETREYVKKVLANSVVYAALLSPATPSLKARLGRPIGPRDPALPAPDAELP